ncbi:hypothetical protein PILCRDRAFT_824745 [Piloderma croceum F 1598]|uniref:Uncharacterized protein n=1 Tax=Piloderma croceum (strain F 1598) TaxID=765440 RepID=A0A0C3FDV1_PILCF|nr:hypothetical protein PILCRDRAFT_824745 [Piloderma croceum F 1598]
MMLTLEYIGVDLYLNDFDNLFAVTVRGTSFCYKYAGLQMVSQGRGGRIIGASSLAGKKGTGLWVLCNEVHCPRLNAERGSSSELGKHGITVNAYASGAFDTPLQKQPDLCGNK